jgi:uncharacterized phage-associated protein
MANLTASDVADYFLTLIEEDSGDNISNLKLQKLVYYAQGFHLALHDGQPLFEDTIEAWTHGPVVPALYHRYKVYGPGAIPPPESLDASKFDEATRDLLEEVWKVYGQFSAWKLRDMIHEEPPWKESPPGSPISQESMGVYFQTLLVHGQPQ